MPAPKQFTLPFATQSENRKEPFSKEAEAAAIFALSELERKAGGLTSKQEKTVYITKVGYPIWVIVRGNATYLFDGLNRTSYVLNYFEASQTDFVLEDFEASFRIREEYLKFLGNYQKSFQQTLNKKELSCEGLIADNALLSELNTYRKEATEVYGQSLGLFSPVLRETEVTSVIDQIETLQAVFKEKTEKIKQLTELVSKTSKMYTEGLHFESKAATEEIEAKIKAQKEIINPKIEKLTNEYKKQVERLEKNFDKEKQPLKKQQDHIEKTIKEKEAALERYSKQAKTQANKSNKRSENSLKKKIKKEKRELDEFKKQLKNVERQLKTLAEQQASEIFRLKREFDENVQVERQPITALEASRDEKQESFKQEIVKLEKLTQPVLEELGKFVAQRENILSNMAPLSIESDLKLKNNALLHIPFYIAVYGRADSEAKRYFVFPPALVSSLGFSAKLRGAFGMAKIRNLFSERFRSLYFFAEKIRLNASLSSEFEAQIAALAQKSNILNEQAPLKDGLFLLKDEGWLSEQDYQNLISTLQAVSR
ncbi:MAG: hypothetical protein ACFCUE_15475 [Candidatus Bathyarchaeia archaeon]|jgi:hypothetical protein